MAAWFNLREGGVHIGSLKEGLDAATFDDAVHAFMEFAVNSSLGGYLPGSLEVNDDELADYLV